METLKRLWANRKRIFKDLLYLAIILIVASIALTVLMYTQVFSYLVGNLVDAGFNIWLARALSILPTVLIVYGFNLCFSIWSKRNRTVGVIIITTCLLLFFLGMYKATSNFNYDPNEGNPLNCYAYGMNKYEQVPCSWKNHPQSGNPVIKDPVQIQQLIQGGQIVDKGLPRIQRLTPDINSAFFSPVGQPLIWYFKHPDGRFELFANPGMHPQLNIPLKPITSEVAIEILSYIQDGQKNMIVSSENTRHLNEFQGGSDLENLRDFLLELQKK